MQVFVGTALDDPAVIQHHDGVGVLHGGQAVRDDKDRAVRSSAHPCRAGRWPRCGYRWSWLLRPGSSQAGRPRRPGRWPAAGAAPGSGWRRCRCSRRIVALRAGGVMKSCAPASCAAAMHSSSTGVQVAVADVFHHGAGEQVGILQHDAQAAAQVCLFDLVDVDAVIADLAVVRCRRTG